jgi:hypothetical protein
MEFDNSALEDLARTLTLDHVNRADVISNHEVSGLHYD